MSEGELISALHPYEIRVFTCSTWYKEKSTWLEGRIEHLRDRLEEHRSQVCERSVLQGDRGGLPAENPFISQVKQRPNYSTTQRSRQG
jgi:hypothetical protein